MAKFGAARAGHQGDVVSTARRIETRRGRAFGTLEKRSASDELLLVPGLPGVKSAVRRVGDSVWTAAERLANRVGHARRHREVARRIARDPRPERILVICHANLCRSPYMAAVLQRLLPNLPVTSAGLFGAGRRVPAEALECARHHAVDLGEHRSTLLTRSIIDAADLVVVMEPRQARMLIGGFGVPADRVVVAGDLDPRNVDPRRIEDPWGKDLATFERTFLRLGRCARALARMLPP